DQSRIGRPRHIHHPGIQQEPIAQRFSVEELRQCPKRATSAQVMAHAKPRHHFVDTGGYFSRPCWVSVRAQIPALRLVNVGASFFRSSAWLLVELMYEG